MKGRFFKRALAIVLCASLMNSSEMITFANSVSAGDVQIEQNVSQGDAVVGDVESVTGNDVATPVTVVTVPENQNHLFLAAAPNTDTVKLTVNRYLGDTVEENDRNMLFKPHTYDVKPGDMIGELGRSEENYEISYITMNGNVVTLDESGQLKIEAGEANQTVVNIFYKETTSSYKNATVMYDYHNGRGNNGIGRASDENSINYYKNYSSQKEDLEDGSVNTEGWNNRISTLGAWRDYGLRIDPNPNDTDTQTFLVNDSARKREDFTGNFNKQYPILLGLLNGLENSPGHTDYDIVKFNYDEPGFFSSEPKNGKEILTNYSLEFNRTGALYQLSKVWRTETNADGSTVEKEVCTDLTNFFPLNTGTTNNEYFGMRYDFAFSLGDYVGDLTYNFIGDDDLWVCMNGEVVLDLGGIHAAYPSSERPERTYAPASVDLWTKLLGKDNYTMQDKIDFVNTGDNATKSYTITVLFMERGGTQSNCFMSFVLPNIKAKPPVVSSKAILNIKKVDAKEQSAIANVSFQLVDEATQGSKYNTSKSTDGSGLVSFGELDAGTYVLTETVPEGYLPDGPWKITVSSRKSGNTIISDVTEIVNTKSGEVIESDGGAYTITNMAAEDAVSQEKKASLVNWNDRIYKIELKASSMIEAAGNENVSSSITGAIVIDYIDERFEMTDGNGNVLQEGSEIADRLGNKGVARKNEDDMWYVEWPSVTIPVKEGNVEGWSAEIYVKAKEDFLGGNMIPTNGSGSGITVNGTLIPFDKPTVNVKELELSIGNKEVTLFKGEQVTPEAYMNEIGATLQNVPTLNEEQIQELITNKSLTIDYQYAGEKLGALTYTVLSADEWAEHKAVKVGEKVERYQMQVTYTPDTVAERQKNVTGYELPDTKEMSEETVVKEATSTQTKSEDGIYTVNVVAGTLTVSKTVSMKEIDSNQGDPIFTFKVMKDGAFFCYKTVRFSQMNRNNETVTAPILENLEKGVYTVEELSSIRYELETLVAEGAKEYPADVEKDDAKATFGIGRNIEAEATVLDNRNGIAGFTNKKVNDNNFSDTDVVVNSFIIDESGNISWTANSLEGK